MRSQKNYFLAWAVLAALFFTAVPACFADTTDFGESREVAVQDLPPAVLQTMKRNAAGMPLSSVVMDRQNGKVTYTATVTRSDGNMVTIMTDEKGNLLAARTQRIR